MTEAKNIIVLGRGLESYPKIVSRFRNVNFIFSSSAHTTSPNCFVDIHWAMCWQLGLTSSQKAQFPVIIMPIFRNFEGDETVIPKSPDYIYFKSW
jgi:hypothetical protein